MRDLSQIATIEYISGPDGFGRYMFFLYWPCSYFPGDPSGEYREGERAQMFHADPRKYGYAPPKKSAQTS